ncbi:hypothetical protein BH10ACI4_BH10ACI4_13440 [soil metagenome]
MRTSFFIGLLASFLAPASIAATPQFSQRFDIPTQFQRLEGLAIADFNGDGKPDLAVTDGGGKRVVVYLNNGSGAFGAPISTTIRMTALSAGSIVTGDFNEDGRQDVIVSTVAGVQTNVYLAGNGDGSFVQQLDLPGSYGFESGVVADINGDSHLDLITGGNGSLAIYVGDGHGSFQQQTFSNQGGNGLFLSVAAADVNKDGKLDFVTTSPLNVAGIRTYLGAGDGTFAPSITLVNSTFTASQSVAIADFNGDGKQDLIVGSDVRAYVILGNGDGTFDINHATVLPSASVSYTLSSGSFAVSPLVAVADVDSDTKTDVIVANPYSTSLGILVNDGTGKFLYTPDAFNYPIDRGTSQLRTADLNGDGLPDFILANLTTQNISIFLSIRPKLTPAITLTANTNSQWVGSALVFTAKVAGSNNTVPTSTITLMDGTTALGQQTLDSGGQASFSISTLSAGQHSLSINYSGDARYLTTTSASITQSVTDFQIAVPIASQTVAAGAAASYTINLTPIAALTGTVAFTCSQLPALSTCDAVSSSINGQPTTVLVTVHTTASTRSQMKAVGHALSVSFPSLILLGTLSTRRRRLTALLMVFTAFISLGFGVGCSGSSSAASAVTPGTPTGTSSFTVTGSVTSGGQTVTHSTAATLIVQ